MSEKKSEESVPVQELKRPAKLSFRRLVRTVSVVSLSCLCVVGGVLLYHLSLDDFGTMPPPKRRLQPINRVSRVRQETNTFVKEKMPSLVELSKMDAPSVSIETKNNLMMVPPLEKKPPLEQEETPVVKKEAQLGKTDEIDSVKEKTIETQQEAENKLIDVVPPIDLNPQPVVVEPSPVVEEGHIALGKALRLRDQLQSGRPCLDSLQIILKNRLPDEDLREHLTDRLMPICTASSAYQELNTLFVKNRKEALITYYRNKTDNRFWAYLKAIMTTIVDVRRINPVKRKPKDIISLAQNALSMHDIALAVGYIQELPAEIQADFGEFNGLARAYMLAQEAADEFILSFEKKGK